MTRLFSHFTVRGVSIPNRVWVSPMCQYSSDNGLPTDWHLVHLGSLARGGAGLVLTEATAVTSDGRISPWDAGIWNDAQGEAYRRITDFIVSQGAVPGIQLSHAGRKGSTNRPWLGGGPVAPVDGGWQTTGASPIAWGDYPAPRELTESEIAGLVQAFADGARRAVAAGFAVIELHAAHGYLLHQFLSPLSNQRSDGYGGDLFGRARFLLETVDAVRSAIGDDVPLFVRVSATDWVPGGLTVAEVAQVASMLAARQVDLIDVSSGGLSPEQTIEVKPGYQVPFADEIKHASGLPVAAVGLITEPGQAEDILAAGHADAVLLARALLREPTWPQRAAFELGDDTVRWAPQYERGRRRR